jgi:hypothetical protein
MNQINFKMNEKKTHGGARAMQERPGSQKLSKVI